MELDVDFCPWVAESIELQTCACSKRILHHEDLDESHYKVHNYNSWLSPQVKIEEFIN